VTCGFLVISLFVLPDQICGAHEARGAVSAGGWQSANVSAKLLHTISGGDFHPWFLGESICWWSPDSRSFALLSVDYRAHTVTVSLYDAATGKARAEIKIGGPLRVYFTPNSSALVIHSDRVRLYDTADGKLLREFAEGTTPINGLYVIKPYYEVEVPPPDDNFSSAPSNKDMLRVLPRRYISDRIISPDGTSLLARGKEGKAQVYDLSTGGLKFTLGPSPTSGNKKDKEGADSGEFSPDGRLIVTTPAPRLWNASTGDLIADLGPQSDDVYGARFSHDSRFVATSSDDGIVKVLEATTGKLLHTIGSKKEPIYFAVWNPANNSFVTKSPKWEISVWDAETGGLICKLNDKAIKEKFDDNLTFVYSPDGKLLLTDPKVKLRLFGLRSSLNQPKLIAHLWDIQTGSLIATLGESKGNFAPKFLWGPAGDFLITAGSSVKIWNRHGELMRELDGNAQASATLSPDGKLLAIAGYPPELLAGGLGGTYKEIFGVFVGKIPKYASMKTSVWQITDR
jgi:WD40 repeat protein